MYMTFIVFVCFPIFLAAMVALAFSFPIEDEDKMDL